MIKISNLSAGYGDGNILNNISLTIPEYKLSVIAGPNGSGKSTLLKSIAGIIRHSGTVEVNGINLESLSLSDKAKRIAYLAQNRSVPEISVSSLVLHGRFPYLSYPRRYRNEDKIAVDEALEKMGIINLKNKMVSNLSGGERQKVYIAMALCQGSDILLLDEPTTFLDISHQLELLEMARKLCTEGKTVVMVLHDLSHALEIADYFVLMDRGQIISSSSPEDVYASRLIDKVFDIEVIKEKDHWWCKKHTN